MYRAGKLAVRLAFAGLVAVWAGFAFTSSTSVVAADEPKTADLTALRDAIEAASKNGQNVDEVRKALVAFEKALPNIKPGTVPPELQALRDAVDAAARKGENVDEVSKQLLAIEMAIAGKSLAKPKPAPQPNPNTPPNRFPQPIVPFPEVPFPALPPNAGVDAELLKRALELQKKAQDLMRKNPRDPEAVKLLAEATEMMLKAGGAGGGGAFVPPLMPDLGIGRIPDRPRLGIRMEKVTPALAEQLGLEVNQGIVISSVIEGSAAEKAGLKAFDIILEFAGKKVSDSPEEFARMVNEVKTGVKVDMVLLRKGKKMEVKGIELPDMQQVRPQPRPLPALPPLPVPQPGLVPPALLPGLPQAPPGERPTKID